MSAQAVGRMVGQNPISLIVPCHRVVSYDGSHTGYAAGLAIKHTLLRLERILLWVLLFVKFLCCNKPINK
ncbi:MAG: MGMT family protein [Bacteroidales bacterium]|nr:MGMT family protein [Bacteroidales bacterium]MBQ3982811.1 MGMT family protein [Bacteroidales bacterium]